MFAPEQVDEVLRDVLDIEPELLARPDRRTKRNDDAIAPHADRARIWFSPVLVERLPAHVTRTKQSADDASVRESLSCVDQAEHTVRESKRSFRSPGEFFFDQPSEPMFLAVPRGLLDRHRAKLVEMERTFSLLDDETPALRPDVYLRMLIENRIVTEARLLMHLLPQRAVGELLGAQYLFFRAIRNRDDSRRVPCRTTPNQCLRTLQHFGFIEGGTRKREGMLVDRR